MRRFGRDSTRVSTVFLVASSCLGCAGGAPLLHPAHVLRPEVVSIGAGLSGEAVVAGALASAPDGRPAAEGGSLSTAALQERHALESLTVAPGVAPWTSLRVGIQGSNEAGLTYTGRALRLDGRHAFALGEAGALSIGLGVAALFAEPPGEADGEPGVYGAGFDVPVLLGYQSDAGIYAAWIGPRLGVELFDGRMRLPLGAVVDASGHHLHLGLAVGVRAGFRHIHVALEASLAVHRAEGELDGIQVLIEEATIAPGGGLSLTF